MANGDLDVVIRQLAKQQNKGLLAAAKKQRNRYASLAAKAKDKPAKDRYRQLAKDMMEHAYRRGAAAADLGRQRRRQFCEIDAAGGSRAGREGRGGEGAGRKRDCQDVSKEGKEVEAGQGLAALVSSRDEKGLT